MKTLSGYICVRNALRLDYCIDLSIKSLLPVCQEVVVCDSDSDDGTREMLDKMVAKDPRIRAINWPWTNPRGVSHHAWIEWLNHARQHLTADCQITLDADEVLDDRPECHLAIHSALQGNNPARFFDRLNFWKDAHHLIPEGHCCGKFVARMGPTDQKMHSDEPLHPGESALVDNAVRNEHLKIFHLGFLRDRAAFYRKARAVSEIWFNRFDERLEKGELEGKELAETECDYSHLLAPYKDGYYPEGVREWLQDRNRL
jgi:glycosyltransferase involved in cell wall biosynthesis